MFLFQANVSGLSPEGALFSLSPTTVYGVLAMLLFTGLAVVGKLYLASVDKSIVSKDEETKRLNSVISSLSADNKELNKVIQDMGQNNVRTLEKFGMTLEALVNNQQARDREISDNLKSLADVIKTNLEFNKQLIVKK